MTVIWEREIPDLRHPILVVAFEGWFDVAQGATGALNWLAEVHESSLVASIDPEPYYDFTARRPMVEMVGGERVIRWPENNCSAVKLPDQTHDLLIISGVEPHLRWRTFSEDVVDIARRTATELVITMGALADSVPHTRPPAIKGSSTDAALAARLGLDRPTYEGPTGLIGVLHDQLAKQRLPVISLRAGVPHYIAGTPNPKAMRAMLEHLQHVTGVAIETTGLAGRISSWERQVHAAVESDDDARQYVQQLEQQVDQRLAAELPTGDDLAAEFEKFLAERREDDTD